MNVTRSGAAVLTVAGLTALLTGSALLFTPDAFHASNGIDLAGDVDLLSETRAPGAALAGLGVLMLTGAARARLRFTGLVTAAVLYVAYGLGRSVAWAFDGTPHRTLLVAMVVELAIGVAALLALVLGRRGARGGPVAPGPAGQEDLSAHTYVAVTTFRRTGEPVTTPVWSVPVDGAAFGFYTSSSTGKAKRLAHTRRVVVQPCDMRGRPLQGSRPVDGVARLVTGVELADIRARADAKYGVATTLVRWMEQVRYRLKGKAYTYGDVGIVISTGPSADVAGASSTTVASGG